MAKKKKDSEKNEDEVAEVKGDESELEEVLEKIEEDESEIWQPQFDVNLLQRWERIQPLEDSRRFIDTSENLETSASRIFLSGPRTEDDENEIKYASAKTYEERKDKKYTESPRQGMEPEIAQTSRTDISNIGKTKVQRQADFISSEAARIPSGQLEQDYIHPQKQDISNIGRGENPRLSRFETKKYEVK